MNVSRIKCVAVGDGFVGKTSLLMSLCKTQSEEEYNPTVFDNYLWKTSYNGHIYEILLIDTAGQEGFEMLRKQSYVDANIFLVCFDVSSTSSFVNIKEMWLPEIEECPNATKILVGTKSDLRDDPKTIDELNANNKIFVTQNVAKKLAENYKMKYTECSSKTQKNIEEVTKIIMEANSPSKIENKPATSNSCCCVNPVLRIVKRILCCRNNY